MNRQDINAKLEVIKSQLKQLHIAVENNITFNVYPDFKAQDYIISNKLEIAIRVLEINPCPKE